MKTILITGAATGIGESLAKKLSNQQLILTYHKTNPNKSIGADFYQLDITNTQQIIDFFQIINQKYQTIDILINNAGVCHNKAFSKTNFSEIDDQINTNLLGLIKLTNIFLPIIKETIINIGSECAKLTFPEYATYCASKFGVRGFTKALAKEQKKLKIYCANPGPTSTKMNDFYGIKPEKVANTIVEKLINNSNISSGSDLDLYKIFNIK